FTNDSTYRTYIFCYDTSRKKFTWFAPIGEEGFESPGQIIRIAVNENFVAVCMVNNQWVDKEPQFFIKVFDKASHKSLWQNVSKTIKKLNPVLTIADFTIHNDKLYAMLMDKRFVCFDMKTGKEVWSFKDKDWQGEWWNKWNGYENCFIEHDIVISKDVVYSNAGNAIYAFEPETGKLLWRKLVEKSNLFINIMPVDNGLIVRYQDIQIGYDTPQNPITCECWK
ncbi:MAG: PQQ-binding-like beta-propeller repeat protein, partial [Caldiserica bacterium]|nr:PQQ-binding-like beta-propeller repeat protein [Caldisericota bacterium]